MKGELHSMVELKYGEEIYLETYDVTITQNYLTLEQIEYLVNSCLECETQLQRDEIMISSICAVCTDMYDNDGDATYTFEQVLYSGLWANILNEAPWLKIAVDIIDREVAEYNSVNKSLVRLVNEVSELISRANADEVLSLIMQRIGEDK